MKSCREMEHHVLTAYYVLGTVKNTLHGILGLVFPQSRAWYKHLGEGTLFERWFQEANKGCISKPVIAMDNWDSVPLCIYIEWASELSLQKTEDWEACPLAHFSLVQGLPMWVLTPSCFWSVLHKAERSYTFGTRQTLGWNFAISTRIVYYQLAVSIQIWQQSPQGTYFWGFFFF